MHGSINQLVCSECAAVAAMTPAALRALRGKRGIPCHACDAASLRVRIMLYDDAEGAPMLLTSPCPIYPTIYPTYPSICGIPCHACDAASLRVRIMLYDDAEGAPALPERSFSAAAAEQARARHACLLVRTASALFDLCMYSLCVFFVPDSSVCVGGCSAIKLPTLTRPYRSSAKGSCISAQPPSTPPRHGRPPRA
jgi:hypothetical protein